MIQGFGEPNFRCIRARSFVCLFVLKGWSCIHQLLPSLVPCAVRTGSGCMRAGESEKRNVKSGLLAKLLVQLVFICKTRASCRCHDVSSSDECGSPKCTVRRCGREDLALSLRPPQTSGRFSCWSARSHTHVIRAPTHAVAAGSPLWQARRTDSLNTTQNW